MAFTTRLSRQLGLDYPIFQGGMSWASSNAALAMAVSNAGALGVIAAGPMYPETLRAAIHEARAGTTRPFAVNVPLYGKYAAAHLDVVLDEHVPIVVASQGGPAAHIARFKAQGITWIHVVASTEHARKAEAAGVDAVVAVGGEAGGHPAPSEVTALVLVRAVVKSVGIPVIGAGGVADGAGVAAMFCLGVEGVELGTRFLLSPESNVHAAYKRMVLDAGIADTTLVGRGALPVRVLENEFTAAVAAAERSGAADDVLAALYASRSLKQAALDGDVRWGKVEAGQCAGLIDELMPAGDIVRQLVMEFEATRARLCALAV